MTRFIALFRGLNVGGHKAPMAELRALLEAAGARNVATYIQSGNAVFDSGAAPGPLTVKVERAFKAHFGYASDMVLRTLPEWREAMAASPFRVEAKHPKTVHIGFFKSKPDSARTDALDLLPSASDRLVVRGREAHLLVPNGLARSKLANALLTRNLGTPVTLRNWRTVEILEGMAAG
jgi:uncharacterized protein (DUF1697 family)